MTYYLTAYGLLVLVLVVVAMKNHHRLSRVTIATLVTLMALRELAIPLYADYVRPGYGWINTRSQAVGEGSSFDSFREGALDAMSSYSSITPYVIVIYLFIGAVSWRVLRNIEKEEKPDQLL